MYVYRNITKGCWSVRDNGIVVAHLDSLVVRNAKFRVSESGRRRVVKEKRKNVHAGVSGQVISGRKDISMLADVLQHGAKVRYNPYQFKTFVLTESEEPVSEAAYVLLDAAGGVHAIGCC
jgi:hypothetical protein